MSDDFTRHVLRVMIAKAAEKHDFSSISGTALEIFVDSVVDRLSSSGRQ